MYKQVSIGLIGWYQFEKQSKVLIIPTSSMERESWDDILEYFRMLDVEAVVDKPPKENGECESRQYLFDYVISIGAIEESENPIALLEYMYRSLSENGAVLIGCYNKLGVGSFSYGDRIYERLLNRNNSLGRRFYSVSEMDRFIKESKFKCYERYGVLPDFKKTQILLRDGFVPNELIADRFDIAEDFNLTSLYRRSDLFEDLFDNGLFYKMCDEYLLELRKTDFKRAVNMVVVSADRDKTKAFATMIIDDIVIKKPLFSEGIDQMAKIHDNHVYLEGHGVRTVGEKLKDDCIEMPYVDGVSLVVYLQELMKTDLQKFFAVLDGYRDLLISSSEVSDKNITVPAESYEIINKYAKIYGYEIDLENIDLGPIYKKGFLDLVPLNILYKDGEFIVFDQEFCEADYPVNAILYRGLCCIYAGKQEFYEIYDFDELLARYGLKELKPVWDWYTFDFLETVNVSESRGRIIDFEDEIIDNNLSRLRDVSLALNRERYLSPSDLVGRDIYVWGTGKYSNIFFDNLPERVNVKKVIDNDKSKSDTLFHNIEVIDGECISSEVINDDSIVVICVKNYWPIVQQLIVEDIWNFKIFTIPS